MPGPKASVTLVEEGEGSGAECVWEGRGGAGEKQGKKMDEQPEGTLG